MIKNFPATETIVFVSYSKKDEALAQAVVRQIQTALLVNVWWDQKLKIGKSYSDEIREAVEAARLVVVLWTEKSVRSEFVIDEATRAKEADKLFPITIGKPSLPPGFGLRQGILVEALDGIAAQDLEKIGDRIRAALPPRIVRAMFNGDGFSPVVTVSGKESDEVSILNGQIAGTKLCLVAQDQHLITLMPFVMALRIIGYRVGLATSNGEYDRAWYEAFMGALDGADVVLVSWFPFDREASDHFRVNEMKYLGEKCMLHMPFGSITVDETRQLVARFRNPEREHFFKTDRLGFALSGDGLAETLSFVRLISELTTAAKGKGATKEQFKPVGNTGKLSWLRRLLKRSSAK